MAGLTVEIAQARLTLWLEADAALTTSQSYEIESEGSRRKLTRADVAEVRNNIEFWDKKVRDLAGADAGGRRKTRYAVPGYDA